MGRGAVYGGVFVFAPLLGQRPRCAAATLWIADTASVHLLWWQLPPYCSTLHKASQRSCSPCFPRR